MIVLLLILLIGLHEVYANDVLYYIYDSPNRSVTSIVDNSEEIVGLYQFNAFGETIQETVVISNVYQYNSEQNDKESNLIFLRNRYYDPSVGRFTTKDFHPGISYDPQTKNQYIYCTNCALPNYGRICSQIKYV
ncbi:MAG: hypothetical protein KKF54_07560 [Candidatus Omnitrophica bacterium]|nr:hypothetical protein [Candidatus Omnitrophota bacterium]